MMSSPLADPRVAAGPWPQPKVATDENGENRGYGFVHFETEESALKAIKKVNGMLLNGRKVFVGKFIPLRERSSRTADPARKSTNVYIKNLGVELEEEDLRKICETYGKILSLKIMTDMEGNSRGLGFVSFVSHEAAAVCVDDLNGKEHGGRQLFAGLAQKKSERSAELRARFDAIRQERSRRFQGVNLYIKNLDDDIDDERLRKEFSRFGNITSVKVMKNDKEVSRGFGFVCFSLQEEATKAMTEMNGRIISVKQLYVALAQRKEVRQAQLAIQYMRMNMNYRAPVRLQTSPTGTGKLGRMNQIYPGFNTYYPTMPAQRSLYTGQLAQVHSPRWPTGQTRPAGQTGYQAMQGAARQFGAPTQIRATIPSRVPVQGTPSGGVPSAHGVPGGQTMCMDKPGAAQRTVYKHPQTRTNQAVGAEERSRRFQGVNLYIKNLDDDIDDERLRKEFSRFGNITSVKVMKNDKEVSRGFGFVCFSLQEEATKAMTEMNGRIISVKQLYVALAQRKEVRQAQLAIQYMRMNMNYRAPMNQIYPGFNTYYPTMPPQRSLYTGQLAQVHSPRWSTAQTRPAGQTGYQAMQGAARQFGAPTQIRATIPSRVPVQGTPSGGVPSAHGVPGGQTMCMDKPGAAQRTVYKHPQTRTNQAVGAEETRESDHQAIHVPGHAPLTAQMLAQAQPHEQKQMLGERLFSIIQQSHGDFAGKITGMLLEMDNAELLHMLESDESLKAKITEALHVLAVHQQKEQKKIPVPHN